MIKVFCVCRARTGDKNSASDELEAIRCVLKGSAIYNIKSVQGIILLFGVCVWL